jgi:hypothetical protein
MSDRNRFDFRFVSGQEFSWRYRNRLSLERNFSFFHRRFSSASDKTSANSALISTVATFRAPFCRPPVFRPFAMI